ncbi:MAG TPA: prolyl oligopeptidase family serine peptidase [Longimicrobiales bacterium]|nr:prolyl oligopeptidase family serine peptidase [Longimicrobiales bacterium]
MKNLASPRPLVPSSLPLWLALFLAAPLASQDRDTDALYRTPAPELAALVDAPRTPGVSLSPDRSTMLLMQPPSLPSIAEVSAPEARLGGLRINPRNTGPSRGTAFIGLSLRDLEGRERPVRGLPDAPRIRNVGWAPDGAHVAFTQELVDRVELWVVDVASAEARRLIDRPVNAAYGAPYSWVPDGRALLVRAIPEGRGPAPSEPDVPTGPVIQETAGEAAPARTYQDLLEDPHDEELFEHFATSQLLRVDLEGRAVPLGEPALRRSVSPSPDGEYVLVQTTHRPFSYLVPASRFPNRIEVWDMDGSVVAEIADLPVQDQVPAGFGSVPTGVRSISWRADAPATLAWVEALDGGDGNVEAAERDRVFTLEAPFSGAPRAIATLPLRYGGIIWTEDDFALLYESWFATRQLRAYTLDPDDPGELTTLFEYSMEDRYADPGFPLSRRTRWGTSVAMTADDGRTIFLSGQGASPEGDRPFLRKLDIGTGETEEVFRSTAPYYEMPIDLLDGDEGRLLTRRESNDEPPNYFVRDLDDGTVEPVTDFPHPYPELAAIQKEAIQYEREDGVTLTATLYLPPGYDAERDGPLPTFVWAYPVEFKSADAAGQRTDSPHRFTYVSYQGAVPWVMRGYAVLDDASMPIVGEGDEEPNDTFREQLVASAQAAIDEGVRRGVVDPNRVGVGGHSYGAFMTGNLLAHSDLFRAGIARSGAYNRSLTPFGFQREERLFWDAPEIYFDMSPFMHADKIDEPILLIHGEADNNSGTFPLQSERFYNAIKGLGGTARLVMLPAESHGYAARESLLHMLWEMDRWLEKYVKNAEPRVRSVSEDGGSR